MNIEAMEQDHAQQEILKVLVEQGALKDPALGIAKQVLDKGVDSLSGKQQYVYDTIIAKRFKMECSLCHEDMETNDIPFALMEGDRLCGHCRHRLGSDND